MHAQDDQNLRCPHMPEDKLSHGAAQIITIKMCNTVIFYNMPRAL